MAQCSFGGSGHGPHRSTGPMWVSFLIFQGMYLHFSFSIIRAHKTGPPGRKSTGTCWDKFSPMNRLKLSSRDVHRLQTMNGAWLTNSFPQKHHTLQPLEAPKKSPKTPSSFPEALSPSFHSIQGEQWGTEAESFQQQLGARSGRGRIWKSCTIDRAILAVHQRPSARACPSFMPARRNHEGESKPRIYHPNASHEFPHRTLRYPMMPFANPQPETLNPPPDTLHPTP